MLMTQNILNALNRVVLVAAVVGGSNGRSDCWIDPARKSLRGRFQDQRFVCSEMIKVKTPARIY